MVRGYVSYYHSVVGWLVLLTCMRQDAENLEDCGAGHGHQQLDMNRRCFQESTPASDEATVAGLVQNVKNSELAVRLAQLDAGLCFVVVQSVVSASAITKTFV
jgi:hypothetical protein